MRKYLSYFLFFIFQFILSLDDCSGQNGIIKGVVKAADEVLPFASVSLGKETVFTDYAGEFRFSLSAGTYTLTITHTGYKKIVHHLKVEAGNRQIFEFTMIPAEKIGEEVVLGSRSPVPRSNLNTPVPVAVFSSAQLIQTGQPGLTQMLSFSVPSFNASRETVNEPFTMRGLSPDHTLILLNNKRYHSMAYIHEGLVRGQLGKGAVPNDLNSIPFPAIEKIEFLFDGASAQYGSDAIAAVANIVLKESTGKTSVNIHLGQQYEGDGENFTVGINHGIPSRKKNRPANRKGFLNFSGDFHARYPTDRNGEYKGTVYYPVPPGSSQQQIDNIKALDDQKIWERGGFDRRNVANAGTTKLNSLGILMNGAYYISNKTQLFWTGSLNKRINILEGHHIFPKNVRLVNTELFPDGFKGRVKPVVWNVAAIAGAKGTMGKGVNWEYSSAYGQNYCNYYSENTNNPSQQYTMGKNAQTTFYTAAFIYHQLTNNIHFTKNISKVSGKLDNINLGWGAELRFENFRMKAGEEAAWKNYDPLLRKQGGASSSHIIYPENTLNKNRAVAGAYFELESEFDDRLLFNLASRFEHYSDFGGNLAGKLAIRYKLSDKFSLRGSVGNGFRAPSMQQRYYGAILGGVRFNGGVLTGTTRGIFNNEHTVTKLFGVPSLEAEKSMNLSGGLTLTLSQNIYMTIDAYWIQIKDRVVLSGVFDRLLNPEVDSLLNDSSLNGHPYIEQVTFFTNAINTRTMGIDLVLNGKWNIKKGNLNVMLAANFTQTRLFGKIKTASNLTPSAENQNTLFNEEERTVVEKGQPRDKIILGLNYKKEKFGFVLRNTHFGKTAFHYTNRPPESFSSKILTDISISYAPKSWLTITTGVNNLFDVYPDRIKNYENTGEGRFIYAMEASPFGFNGGYYYLNMSFYF